MAADTRTIQVLQVPSVLHDDRMIDKLMIHFLRPRHGGGEVLQVLYPTGTPGQALVTFELQEVADRVVQRPHVLQLQEQSFPLKVSWADRPEVDLPVKASLDLRFFPDPRHVRELLHTHGFTVTTQDNYLFLEGSFLKLRAVRTRLQQLQLALPGEQVRGPPAQHYPPHLPSGEQGSSRMPRLNGQATGAVSKSRVSREQYDDLGADTAVSHHSSHSLHNGSGLGSSRESLHSPAASASTLSSPGLSGGSSFQWSEPSTPWSPSRYSRNPLEVSFPIDTNTLCYAQSLQKQELQAILERHAVQLRVKEDKEISTVTLTLAQGSRDADRHRERHSTLQSAQDQLLDFLLKVKKSLRTQVISPFDVQLSRAQRLADVYKVLVDQVGDRLLLVGPSRESYELKQILQGNMVSLPAAGRQGRGERKATSVMRSSSLPRQPSWTDVRGPEQESANAKGYSPARYQKEQEQEQGAAGSGPSLIRNSFRRRSNSESRKKIKTGQAQGLGSPVGTDTDKEVHTERVTGKHKTGMPTLKKTLGKINNTLRNTSWKK
ncbi:RNA-binding protein 43 [Amia ocellicauda]|uniref:RNA-binding protein 43 n=1 Tax=Amia ocellicauda TaxID=2972642 RepID=UPI00346478FA